MFLVNFQSSFSRPLLFQASSFSSFLLDGGLAARRVAVATIIVVVVIVADGAEGWRGRKPFGRRRLQVAPRDVAADKVGQDAIRCTDE